MYKFGFVSFLAACASDGGLKTYNDPPNATIVSPTNGQAFWEYAPLTLEAEVSDNATAIDDLTLVWSAGSLGKLAGTEVREAGRAVLVVEDGLPAGDWSIGLLVTDEEGESDEDAVSISVSQNQLPHVTLLSPAHGASYAEGETVPVSALVTDADAVSNEELTLTWAGDGDLSSAPAFPQADGYAEFSLTGVAAGDRSLSVTVTDAAGDTETATVDFTVIDGDLDGDGFEVDDCNDTDAAVHPGAVERCDGVDNDCDGAIDLGATDVSTWYADTDGDGYGGGGSVTTCAQPAGYAATNDDCDDANWSVSPGATELCNDRDDDCDAAVDESAADETTWFLDADGDGYGDDDVTLSACDEPAGYVSLGGDCEDGDIAYNPGASEDCADATDYNCDGSVAYADADADGFAACDDCDDSDALVNASGVEVCDGVDDDCDGAVDEDTAADAGSWYADADGDAYGNGDASVTSCTGPSGYVADAADCDDSDSLVHPGATEVCGGADEDCDGVTDESGARGETTWYLDADTDGYGGTTSRGSCTAPAGYVAVNGDCDDGDSGISPVAYDIAGDGIDQDCDGSDAVAVCGTLTLSVPGDYATIQDAIDAACDGDVVDVAAGTYVENIDFSAKDITVQGAGADYTTIDGDYNGTSVVTMDAGTLTDLTVTNGLATDGGGLFVSDLAFAISRVAVLDNLAARYGGGVYSTASALGFSDCEILGNTAAGYGGGMYSASGSGLVTLTDSTLAQNTAAYGGGLALGYTARETAVLDSIGIHENTATAQGGGIYSWRASVSVSDSDVSDNSAGDYGGGAYIAYPEGTWENVAVSRNTARNYYGGLAALGTGTASFVLTDLVLADNSAATVGGLALHTPAGSVTTNLRMSGTTGSPAVYITGGDVVMSGVSITQTDGTALYATPSSASDHVEISNSTIVAASGIGVQTWPTWVRQIEIFNTISSNNAVRGIFVGGAYDPDVSYSDVYENAGGNYSGMTDPTGTDGNIAVNPEFLLYSADIDSDRWDLHLCPGSPLIDAGDPSILDPDGTRSDIGAYGGPNADFTYYEDNDGDGMYDGWEDALGLDSSTDDGTDDLDGDGLTNADEFALCIDVSDADSDDDGLTDAAEVLTWGTDPLDADSDGDGTSDRYACALYADADADGYGDSAVSTTDCLASTHVSDATDCDDTDDAVNPGETEICDNGTDDDCDGSAGSCALSSDSLSTADAKYTGVTADDLAGYAVDVGGDVNGDGYDDMLIGAPRRTNGYYYGGAAYLVLGSATPTSASLSTKIEYIGESTGLFAGGSVSCGGDVNGDGLDDIVIGDPDDGGGGSGAGTAYLVLGSRSPSGSYLSAAIHYDGSSANESVANAVDLSGDYNDDGLNDILMGAGGNDVTCANAGAAGVMLGTASPATQSFASLMRFSGSDCQEIAGSDLSNGGDVDGDGLDDFVVGAYANDDAGTNAGAAYLVYGDASLAASGLSAAVQYRGVAAGDQIGAAVASAGDFNADGYADLVFGSSNTGSGAGAAYVILGRAVPASSVVSTGIKYSGEAANDYAGGAVNGGGDMDNDGYADVVVGASGVDDGGSVGGAAYLLLGTASPSAGSLADAVQLTAEAAGDQLGSNESVAIGGDINGDGFADALVGALYQDAGASNAGAAYLRLGGGL